MEPRLAVRVAREAVEHILTDLRQAVGCITQAPLTVRQSRREDAQTFQVALGDGRPVALGGSPALSLVVRLRIRLDHNDSGAGWDPRVMAYWFALMDADGRRELLAYHWHPDGGSSAPFPHLHLGAGVEGLPVTSRVHLPTGHVLLSQVVFLAISELGVPPLRTNWRRVLMPDTAQMA